MNRKTIDSYIVNVIEESLKATLQRRALREKEVQDATSAEKPVEKDAGEETEKLKKGDVTVEDVIEKLNAIRSGKSLKDEDILSSLEKYFEGLDTEEKTALLAFLKGISQIVTGEVSASAAIDPGDKPVGIEMEKTSGAQKVSIKPNVIKAPEVKKDEKPSAEDTTGPVPISAKKK